MNLKGKKFSSYKILNNQVNNLISQKLSSNMNFIDNKNNKITSKTKALNNANINYGLNNDDNIKLNTSDIMVNFFQSKKKEMKPPTKKYYKYSHSSPFYDVKLTNNSSHLKIARNIQDSVLSKHDSSSFYETLINQSSDHINHGLRSSSLGKSLLDISIRSQIGLRERKYSETPLRYEDYAMPNPALNINNKNNRKSAINFSYSNNVENLTFKKEALLEQFLVKNLGSGSKRPSDNYSILNTSNVNNISRVNKIVHDQPTLESKLIGTNKERLDEYNRKVLEENKLKLAKGDKIKPVQKLKNDKIANKKISLIDPREEKEEIKNMMNNNSNNKKAKGAISKIAKINKKHIEEDKESNTRKNSSRKNVNIFDIQISKDEIRNSIDKSDIEDVIQKISNIKTSTDTQNKERLYNKNMKQASNSDSLSENIDNDLVNYHSNDRKKSSFLKTDANVKLSPIESPVNRRIEISDTKTTSSKVIIIEKEEVKIQNNNSGSSELYDEGIDEHVSDNDYTGDVDEIKVNKVYKSKAEVKINGVSNADTNTNPPIVDVEESIHQYDNLINRYLFGSVSLDVSNNNLNDSRISHIEKDIDSVVSQTDNLKKMKKFYKKEIEKMQNELNDIAGYKNNELIENKEKTLNVIKLKSEFDTLKTNLKTKEDSYKNMIKTLMKEWKNVKNNNEISRSDASEIFDLNDSIMKEINDLIEDEQDSKLLDIDKTRNLNNSNNGNVKEYNSYNSMKKKSVDIKNSLNDSMLDELAEFKKEELLSYKFEIPLKYQIGKNIKIINESVRDDGKLVKYYENSVVEIISKNKNITRLFPDGYSIIYYANKDIKQTFPKGKILYYYSKNKSIECNMQKEGFVAYKFKNNQLEKHYFDGRKSIKFADGSIKIIRPNGEELNEFCDKSIQRKDKNGNISTKQAVTASVK